MNLRLAVLALTVLPLLACAAEPTTTIVMKPAPVAAVKPEIEGGFPLAQKDWPATLHYLSDGEKFCTATLIGERVVLTAAHCLVDGAVAAVEIGGKQTTISCDHHPSYNANGLVSDIALCLAQSSFGIEDYERVSLKPVADDVEQLFLLGYGCTSVATQTGAGSLYGGYSKIASRDSHHIVTKRFDGSVMLCPKDSGGAAFLPLEAEKHNRARRIVGINSGYTAKRSYIAPLSKYGEFIADWTSRHSVAICSDDSAEQHCR